MNTSSNKLWVDSDDYIDWETTRPFIFRDDMRETFFNWFRIKPTDNVLDGGCATGVLTRFIARGLTSGTITGFDISKHYVNFANQKISEEGLSDKAKVVLEDGFNLSFEDNTFDTVVNHTYLGVLSDPVAGLQEMIRVCKHGGNVSASVSASDLPTFSWEGDLQFEKNNELNEMINRYEKALDKVYDRVTLNQSSYWNTKRFPKMFAHCGLKNITIYPYASGFSNCDSYWSDEVKKGKKIQDIEREIELIEINRQNSYFKSYGFSDDDFGLLIKLYNQKKDYIIENIDKDDSWSWQARMHYIVTGMKK